MRRSSNQRGLPASDWESLFAKVGIEKEKLEKAMSAKAKTTILGNFLAQNVDREVPIESGRRTGLARLRVATGRAKTRRYYFEVRWDKPPQSSQAKISARTNKKTGSKPTPRRKSKTQKAGKTETAKTAPLKHSRESGGNGESWD